MRKLLLIARSNLRKAKGQTVAIVVLVLLAALLLNLWLMLSTDYKANFVRYQDKLNAEHVTISIGDDTEEAQEFLTQTLSGDSRISEYLLTSALSMTGTFHYNGGEMNSWFIYLEKQTALNLSVGRIEIVEAGEFESGVYLPMLYKTDDIAVGKPIAISIGSRTVEYTVCGFFNSVMAGSHNCGLTELVFTEDKYSELEGLGCAMSSTLCSVRLNDRSENLTFESELKSEISEQFPNITMVSNSYDIVVQSRYISQSICSAVMCAMAFLVLLISLVVIVSNIINYIQVNIKNLGALKAVGYTSRQLVCSLLLQFSGLTVITAVVGAAASYAVFPAINSMMIAQTGIPYAIRFLPLPAFISLLILGGAVSLSVWLAARRIKKIEPIVALRSGLQTHNFKRNRVPLGKTKVPLNTALALKTTFSGIKQNITVCITMLVLSLVVVFSGLMTENMIIDMTPFLNLIVGETPDSCINVNIEVEKEFLAKAKADERVKKVYLYHTMTVAHSGGAELLATLIDDYTELNNHSVVFDGCFPKYENEIAIAAKYAREQGFKIGNEIEISANGKTEKYLISGFTQISNYLGRDCIITRAGYEQLGTLANTSYYISMTDGADIDAFNAEMIEAFAGNINATINGKTTMEGSAGVYVSLMTILVIAILVLSAIIIAFVLYLLVRTMLNNKKRDYGILKSLGFTTKQLIVQTALSFMPAIILSTVVGIIISCLVINPLLSLFFSSIGIVKCTFSIPVVFSALAGVGLIILSFCISCLLSLRIKKIAPCALIAGE